jgi:hypothetical protein
MKFSIDNEQYASKEDAIKDFKLFRSCAVACLGGEKVKEIEEHFLEMRNMLDKEQLW